MSLSAVPHAAEPTKPDVLTVVATTAIAPSSECFVHSIAARLAEDTEVSFVPRGDKPVYCSDCYRKVKVSS